MQNLKVMGSFLNIVDEWEEEELVARRVIRDLSDEMIVTQFNEEICLGALSNEELDLLKKSQTDRVEIVLFIQDESVEQVFSLDEYYVYLCGYAHAKARLSILSPSNRESQFTTA